MSRKRFYVRVDLQLHAITCPGVWLCTHGYVECTIKALGYYFRTGAMEPRFPLLCHDQFTMEGYFKSVGSLSELEEVLTAEKLELTLWQNGRRLAYFVGKLADVMHPTLPRLSCEHNINVQLLMKATPAFPGIIAPKVELTAQVSAQDRMAHGRGSATGSYCSRHYCTLDKLKPTKLVLDPKQLPKTNRHCQQDRASSCACHLEERRKQQPVCHAKQRKCSAFTSCSTPNSLNSFEADFIAHKNAQRRLSTCSSLLSSTNTNTLSHTSSCMTNSSDCCRSLSNSFATNATTTIAVDDHHQSCNICQEYQRVFLQRPR